MTYQEFSDIFLLHLAESFRNDKIDLHGLVDFDLWRKIFPDNNVQRGQVLWSNINFNAFSLEDDEQSLLIVYSIPTMNVKGEAKFIAFRLDNKRDELLLYSLRRPKYYDDQWDIFQHDFKSNSNTYLQKIGGTDSLREFKASIEKLDFREKPSLFDRVKTKVLF